MFTYRDPDLPGNARFAILGMLIWVSTSKECKGWKTKESEQGFLAKHVKGKLVVNREWFGKRFQYIIKKKPPKQMTEIMWLSAIDYKDKVYKCFLLYSMFQTFHELCWPGILKLFYCIINNQFVLLMHFFILIAFSFVNIHAPRLGNETVKVILFILC